MFKGNKDFLGVTECVTESGVRKRLVTKFLPTSDKTARKVTNYN